MEWPDWWLWELELTPHLLKRMVDRQFSAVDLRFMLEGSSGYHKDREKGRFVVVTTHDGRPCEVIVEPSSQDQVLIVMTAYPLG